jgi:glycosyltransferase involved in cell wall biosynthesis
MKIAYVLTQERGGPADVTMALAKTLLELGEHDVRVFGPAAARGASELGEHYTSVDVDRKGNAVAIAQMRSMVKSWSPTIVHAQDRRSGLTMAGINLGRRVGAVLHTYHGVPEDVSERWFTGSDRGNAPSRYTRAVLTADGAIARVLDRTVVPSSRMGDFLHSRYAVPRSRLVHIDNGVVFPEAAPTEGPIRRLLFVGLLLPRKGLTDLLEALSRPGVMPADATLDIAGDGPSRAEIEALAIRPPLAGRVNVLGFRTDVNSLITNCDALVLPSRMEQQPLVIAQAMAAGKPVVATRTGGVAEMLEMPNVPSYLAQPGDVDGLADAITSLFDNVDPTELGKQSMVRAHERYSLTACAEAHLELYESVTHG